MAAEVTLVVTSCGRPDLLMRTLESFIRYNTYPLADVVVIEDGPEPSWVRSFDFDQSQIYLATGERRGQLYAVDKAYSYVKTPYILHCEDDWEFYRPGFIEASLPILEKHNGILSVQLRAHGDTNGHPVEPSGSPEFDLMALGYKGCWHGFAFNPGLRRLCDYQLAAPFTKFWNKPGHAGEEGEGAISQYYRELGFRVAILPEGYVRHIGWGRSVT